MVLANHDSDTTVIADRLEHARGSRAERPFLLGGAEDNGTVTYVHVHVSRAGSDEATAQLGLAQALRDDASLRSEYASLKQQVVDAGTIDPTDYSIKRPTGSSSPSINSGSHRFLILAHRRR